MEIFISNKFLDEFVLFEDYVTSIKIRSKIEICNKIFYLISSGLDINSDLSPEEITKCFDISGEKKYKNIKDVISSIAIKNSNFKFFNLNFNDIPNHIAYYFLNNEIFKNKNYGVIKVDDLYDLSDFYSNCTLNSLDIGEDDYSLIEKSAPPCNSMILIDKYLFKGEKKLKKLIKFLNIYINDDLEIPFQLTILSSYENNNINIPLTVFNKAIYEFDKIKNLNFQILLDKKIPKDDRIFFTNYTKGNIGHPFDRETIFNQNFLATSQNIKRDYEDFFKSLKELRKFIEKIPYKMGNIITRYENIKFENRIFSNLNN